MRSWQFAEVYVSMLLDLTFSPVGEEKNLSSTLLNPVVRGHELNWLARENVDFIHICTQKCDSMRQNSGLICHLNKGKGERALRGKQMSFRKDKWGLRRKKGDMTVLWQCLLSCGTRSPREICNSWALGRGSPFRQIRGVQKSLFLHLLTLKCA